MSSPDDATRPVQPVEQTSHIPIIDADTEEMTAGDVEAVENLPAGSAMLLVQRGPDSGARFLLDTDVVTVGRHPDSDIFLDDISVSRRHATFTRSDAGYVVADLGSLNGTYVNRDRIDADISLTGGDEVQIGKYRLIYFAGGPKGQA
jgi:pSer/pThr/pTyr-binding forkhead associated (FHA) protein